jgi:hypothetical protein
LCCSALIEDPPTSLVTTQLSDLLLVLFCQSERGEKIFLFVDVVCLEDGGEDGEAVLGVKGGVKVVTVSPGDLLEYTEERYWSASEWEEVSDTS